MKGGSPSGRRRYEKYTEPVSPKVAASGSTKASKDVCAIKFDVQLQKVQASIKNLSTGDDLEVSLNASQIQVFDDSGNIVGSIVSSNNSLLIKCMKDGYTYKATVKSIVGNKCTVTVKNS